MSVRRKVKKFSASCGRTCVALEGPPRAFAVGRRVLQQQTVFPLSKELSAFRRNAVGYPHKQKKDSLEAEAYVIVQEIFCPSATLKKA